MDDAQQRTIANELQKPNYDHFDMLFVWKWFSAGRILSNTESIVYRSESI